MLFQQDIVVVHKKIENKKTFEILEQAWPSSQSGNPWEDSTKIASYRKTLREFSNDKCEGLLGVYAAQKLKILDLIKGYSENLLQSQPKNLNHEDSLQISKILKNLFDCYHEIFNETKNLDNKTEPLSSKEEGIISNLILNLTTFLLNFKEKKLFLYKPVKILLNIIISSWESLKLNLNNLFQKLFVEKKCISKLFSILYFESDIQKNIEKMDKIMHRVAKILHYILTTSSFEGIAIKFLLMLQRKINSFLRLRKFNEELKVEKLIKVSSWSNTCILVAVNLIDEFRKEKLTEQNLHEILVNFHSEFEDTTTLCYDIELNTKKYDKIELSKYYKLIFINLISILNGLNIDVLVNKIKNVTQNSYPEEMVNQMKNKLCKQFQLQLHLSKYEILVYDISIANQFENKFTLEILKIHERFYRRVTNIHLDRLELILHYDMSNKNIEPYENLEYIFLLLLQSLKKKIIIRDPTLRANIAKTFGQILGIKKYLNYYFFEKPKKNNVVSEYLENSLCILNKKTLLQKMVGGLIMFFNDMEHTGTQNEYYDRINFRIHFKTLIQLFIDYTAITTIFYKEFIAFLKAHHNDAVKFSLFLISGIIYLFDEVLLKQKEILEYEELEKNVIEMQKLSVFERRNNEATYNRNLSHYKMFLNSFYAYYSILDSMIEEYQEIVTGLEVIDRLVSHITRLMNTLSSFEENCKKMKKKPDNSHSPEDIKKLIKVVKKIIGIASQNENAQTSHEIVTRMLRSLSDHLALEQNKFFMEWIKKEDEKLHLKIEEFYRKTNAALISTTIPEEFNDQLTNELMENPMKIGNYYIDQKTFRILLTNSSTNPWTRGQLTEESAILDEDLKQKIIEFKKKNNLI